MITPVSITLPQFTSRAGPMLRAARLAEELGLAGIFVVDHFHPPGAPERPIFEGTTALAAAAAVTRKIRVGSLVLRAPARPPWSTAHLAWTVQAMSRERLVLGLGAADEGRELEAYGLPVAPSAERRRAIELTMEALGSPELVLPGVRTPRVWLGGRSRAIRRLAARVADGWNGWGGDPGRFGAEAAELREWTSRRLTVSWGGRLALEGSPGDPGPSPDVIRGSAAELRIRLAAYLEAGADELVVTLRGASHPETLERFALEVAARL